MKVALVYTSTTPELIEMVEREVRKNIREDTELVSLQNPEILKEVREAGYVTPKAASKLIRMYMEAVLQGADAILNICSSVGETADSAQEVAAYIGVPVVRIDEEMCREAVRIAKKGSSRIAILATLPTTLKPTEKTVFRVAREMGARVDVVEGLIDGAFGLNQEQFRKQMLTAATKVADQVDVILLAQGSMAYVEEDIYKATGVATLSSPRFGAVELKKALERKGL